MRRELLRAPSRAPLLAAALAIAAVPASVAGGAQAAAPAAQYHIVQQLPLPGDEGWDYLTFEQGGERLFIAHGSQVLVVDTRRPALAGTVADTPGAHGIALAPELGRGYVSAGRAGTVVVFDLKTLARLKEIKTTGDNPDAIVYDSFSHRVLTFNGRGRNATAIDARTDAVVGTLALDAKPEFAVSDGSGRIFVNLEDRNSIAVIDPQRLRVLSVWPLSGCEEPSGLAIDIAGKRLFSGCDNKVMLVVDAASGHVLGSVPIGEGVDATRFDPTTQLAFASCGEGVLTVARVGAGGVPEMAQSLTTQRGARTMALDEKSHRVFLVTASFGPPPPATPERPHPRPASLPGSFRLLILELAGTAAPHSAAGETR
jgi:DNA-binding beta-propeller fold protein YncE